MDIGIEMTLTIIMNVRIIVTRILVTWEMEKEEVFWIIITFSASLSCSYWIYSTSTTLLCSALDSSTTIVFQRGLLPLDSMRLAHLLFPPS